MIVPEILEVVSSEEACAAFLRGVRWLDGIICPTCGSKSVIKWCRYRGCWRYMCKHCQKTFNDKTGTIFEYSKMGVREWLYISRELEKNKSINRISKDLGRRYKHVMKAAHKVMKRVEARKLLERLSGVVEADEMYVSAGKKGTRCLSRKPRKRGLKLRSRGTRGKDKPPIMGVLERGGKAVLKVARDVSKKTVDGLMN